MKSLFAFLHDLAGRVLNPVYGLSTLCAVLGMLILLSVVVLQIVARFVNVPVVWASDIAGYSLVATTFLAMAPTLRNGVHIRVNLILAHVRPDIRFGMQIWSFVVGLAFACYAAWWCIIQVLESRQFGDLSTGLVPFPLWIPQSFMAVGFTTFALAMLEGLLGVLAGREVVDATAEADDAAGVELETDAVSAATSSSHRSFSAE